MKKITLLFALLITSIGFSQQQQYIFDFEDGDPDAIASNWITFDNNPPPAEIIDNPDLDGVNNTASKVLKVVMGPEHAFYAGVNNSFAGKQFGTWQLDLGVASNKTLSIDINKNYVGTVGIKMGTSTGGTTFQITDQNVGNTVVDEWVTLTWDLSGINPNGDLTNISQMVVFVDWREGMPDRAAGSTILIDNITFGANKLTDPALPTCNDGIMNGDETGIDCGGTSCNACPVELAIPSPEVIHSGTAGTDYISIFSDDLTNINVGNFDPNWGQQTDATQISIQGDNTLKYDNLNYQGTDFNGDKQDVSGMTHLHIDYYTDNTTALEYFLINNSGEIAYNIQSNLGITTGSWVSLDIPLSNWAIDLTTIREIKVVGNGTIYFDNWYFYNSATASIDNNELLGFSMYPNPAKTELNISAKGTIQSADVFNVLGKKVRSYSVNKTNETLDVSNLATGIYLVKYTVDGKVGTAKFIKQ